MRKNCDFENNFFFFMNLGKIEFMFGKPLLWLYLCLLPSFKLKGERLRLDVRKKFPQRVMKLELE